MTTTSIQHSKTNTTRPKVAVRALLKGGLAGAGAGVVAVEAYTALVRALDVPMRAGFLGASHATPLKSASFATGVLVCTFWGTVLAAVLNLLSAAPRRAFLSISSALAGLSLVVPLGAGSTATATKLSLAGAHVMVACVVIPMLARTLPRKREASK